MITIINLDELTVNQVNYEATYFVLNAINFIVRDTLHFVPADMNRFSMFVVDGNLMGINSKNQIEPTP
ncbi:hypothetical protein ACSNN5_29310 [Brevibacillus formosus]